MTFYLSIDRSTCTSTIEHAITTPTIDPQWAINVKPYRIPKIHRDKVQRQTEQMLSDGVIQHSSRSWNSPILVVAKKLDSSGKRKWRVLVDFSKLNDVTVRDIFSIPVISDVLYSLEKSKYFWTVDCASGFWQITVRTEDRPKTAFSTKYRHFEYKSIPFAAATFQRLMTTVLSGMQGLKCLVFLDDIIVFGENLRVHNDKLRDVFARLRMHNLKL